MWATAEVSRCQREFGERSHTLVCALDDVRSAERAVPFVLVLHLNHAADTKQMRTIESDRQPAEGKA